MENTAKERGIIIKIKLHNVRVLEVGSEFKLLNRHTTKSFFMYFNHSRHYYNLSSFLHEVNGSDWGCSLVPSPLRDIAICIFMEQ